MSCCNLWETFCPKTLTDCPNMQIRTNVDKYHEVYDGNFSHDEYCISLDSLKIKSAVIAVTWIIKC